MLATKVKNTSNLKAQITLDRRYMTLFTNIVKKNNGYRMKSLVLDAFDFVQENLESFKQWSQIRDEIPFSDPADYKLYHSVFIGAENWNDLTAWADAYFPDITKYSLYTEMVLFYLRSQDLL